MTAQQAQSFVEAVKNRRGDATARYSALLLFLVGTGCRYGEATALTASDSDLDEGTADIPRTVTRTETGKVTIGSATKTGEKRTIAVPAPVVAVLRRWVPALAPGALVWPAPRGDGSTPLGNPSGDHAWWAMSVKECVAEDATFPESLGRHDLRHTAASLLIQSGASVLQVQRQLGHARPSITLDTYSHMFPTDLDEISSKMGTLLT